MKKKIFFIIFFLFLISINIFSKNYNSYLVGNVEGKIFYEENSTKKYPLASLTKIMTILVVLDEIYSKRIYFYDKIKIDDEILKVKGSTIHLKKNEELTVLDLLKATAMKSANNAAYALAKYIGKGNVSRFVNLMNKKAKNLGLEKELEFHTPHGLPPHMSKEKMDSGTALGLYKLAIIANNYKDYLKIIRKKEDLIKNGKYKITNTLRKILGKEGIIGLKTGYHSKAKWNIVILSKQKGQELIAIVLGGTSLGYRDKKVLELTRKCYKKFEVLKNN